jgi:hypothetical protein
LYRHIWKQLQQLAVKWQQRALQVLGKHHEFGVVAGTTVVVSQLQASGTVDSDGAWQEGLLSLSQMVQGHGQIESASWQARTTSQTGLGRNSSISTLVSATSIRIPD